jgi:hypothetical protein
MLEKPRKTRAHSGSSRATGEEGRDVAAGREGMPGVSFMLGDKVPPGRAALQCIDGMV